MPKKEQTVSVNIADTATIMAISYSTFGQLGWKPQFAGDVKLLGNTKHPRPGGQDIMITAGQNQYTISSTMNDGSAFDLFGKNQKNIHAFITAFTQASTSIRPDEIIQSTTAIDQLREETLAAAASEAKAASEIDEAMNLSKSNLWLTYGLMAINILVFILTIVGGAGLMGEHGSVLIKWGANYAPLTSTGDWWRLFTSTFLHFGIIHILMNMYALYMVSIYLEPMLGKARYITAYVCTGILASLVSLWWHTSRGHGSDSVMAGASGAIFGLYGVFLALLLTNLIPKQLRQNLLQSIGIFVGYNLIYGMKGTVDNSAHIGGLLSGFLVGFLFFLDIKKEKAGQKQQWVLPLVVIAAAAITWLYLHDNPGTDSERKEALSELKNADYKDIEKYNQQIKLFSTQEDIAIKASAAEGSTATEMADRMTKDCLPAWKNAADIAASMKVLDISPELKSKAGLLEEYARLRIKEAELLIQVNSGVAGSKMEELKVVQEQINKITEKLQQAN